MSKQKPQKTEDMVGMAGKIAGAVPLLSGVVDAAKRITRDATPSEAAHSRLSRQRDPVGAAPKSKGEILDSMYSAMGATILPDRSAPSQPVNLGMDPVDPYAGAHNRATPHQMFIPNKK